MEIDFALPSDNSSQLTRVTSGRGRGGSEQEKKENAATLHIVYLPASAINVWNGLKNIFIAEFSVILHEYIIANTIYVIKLEKNSPLRIIYWKWPF